jgi:hypothetical protein
MGLTKNNDIVTLLTQISALKEQVEALQAEVFKKEPEEPEQPNWEEVRVKRDKLLKESDWTMIPGVTVDQRAWSAYRQVLRDLPQTYGVGINISTGITQLLNLDEVGATNTFIRFTNNGTSKVGFFGLSSSGSGVFQSNSELVFGTGGAYDERLRITSAGLVGIGTSVPNHKLHIHSTGNTPAYLRSTNDGTGTGTTDGIVIGMGDATNAYLWNYENGGIVFATNATQRAVIDSAGRVGIGTASPNYNLQVAGTDPTIAINALNASASSVSTLLYRNADGNGNPRNVASIEGESAGNGGYGALAFHTAFNDSLLERFRCDASGRLLIGTSTARSNFYNGSTDSPAFQIEGTSSNSAHASIVRNQGGEGPTLILGCSGGTSLGSNTLVSNGDRIGHINFQATDGAEFVQAANIKAEVDGTPGADDMPGRLVFSTTADGASSPTERLRIDSSGRVGIGTTTPATYLHLLGANTPARGQLSVAGNGDDARITFYRDGAFIGGINGDTTNGVAIAAETGYSITFNPGGGTERARIDSSGRLLVGTSSARADFFNSASSYVPRFQLEGSDGLGTAMLSVLNNDSGGNPAYIILGLQKSGSSGGDTAVASGNEVGEISFQGNDGSEMVAAASIKCAIDGTPGVNDMPGRLVFSTTADGAGSPTERMRISSEGSVLVGTTTDSGSVSNTTPVVAGRFYSFNGSSSAASGSAITMFTAPNTNATYMVVARLPSVQDAANYEAVTLLSANAGASVSLVATPLKTGGLLTISLSGTDVQATQGAGGPATISWVVTRIG